MKSLLPNIFRSLPAGPRWFLLAYLLLFPLSLAAHYSHTFELREVLVLTPSLVWKGQVWRLVTYAFLPSSLVDWAVSTFWLATLILVLGRNWTSLGFWGYCLLAMLAGGLPIVLLKPGLEPGFSGNAAVIFALLAAWAWFHGKEQLLLLGFGEISVQKAVALVLFINALVLMFCCGWLIMVAMLCGGLAGWMWLAINSKLFLGRSPRQLPSERIARLEL